MTSGDWFLAGWALLMTVAAVWIGMRFLEERAERKQRNVFSRWPIRTAALSDLDPVFARNEFGPGLETEVAFLSSGEKGVFAGTSDLEAWILSVLAKRARRMFEFGTCTGKTAYLMARNSPPESEVHTLTLPPEGVSMYARAAEDSDKPTRDALNESRFGSFLYSGTTAASKVRQYFADSKSFDETPLAASVDLVFVDGSHAYSYVKSDTEKALRMLAPGGTVLWHDYAPGNPDVYRYLNELAQSLPLMHLAKTSMVAYRKPT